MAAEHTTSPEIKCPSCRHTWRVKYAFEYQVGTEVECPNCNTVLACVDEDVVRHWVWDQVREKQVITPEDVGSLDEVLGGKK